MPELLVELGCEELPASAVRRAYSDLRDGIVKGCLEAGIIGGGEHQALGTPRRLIICLPDVLARQEDQVKEQRGPALKAAFDEHGKPTPALLGFCRSSGVSPDDLRQDDQYVWVDKKIEGKPAADILAEIIPKAIRALSFDKTMRWGSSRLRFARPIRWIVALLEGKVIPFDIEGVASGNKSRGHRFYAPAEFEAASFVELMSQLRDRKVEPDPATRRSMIEEAAAAAAKGKPDMGDALVDENVFLTEWPDAVSGEFRPEYLELPTPVLVTAMAKHERMFPVRQYDGQLTNRFVFIRNSGETDTVRKGAEWVLNARFNDAKFFFDEDKKSTLDEFLAKTANVVFAEKLGSVRQRADRLASLAEAIAIETGADKAEQILARNAGHYAKADLSTGLVSEMSSLQGVIGGEYAKREGMMDEVCWAIASHYDLAKNPNIDDPAQRTAVRLTLADQLDKLAGYLGIGLAPTGSSDPYGLRRAATILIESAWAWPSSLPPYVRLLDLALDQYAAQKIEVDRSAAATSLSEVFASRYEAMMPEVRYDILDAAELAEIPEEVTSPRRVKLRTEMLAAFASDVEFIQTATRPINIIEHARKKGVAFAEVDPLHHLEATKLDSLDGSELYMVLKAQSEPLAAAAERGDGPAVCKMIGELAEPIRRIFDSTMMMVEEEDIRTARLTLMQATTLQLFTVGDFSKLVIEG